jgi:hypothetical protein
VVLASLTAACDGLLLAPSAPPLERAYALTHYQGTPVPADVGPIPPAPHTGFTDPACRLQVADVNGATLRFEARRGDG